MVPPIPAGSAPAFPDHALRTEDLTPNEARVRLARLKDYVADRVEAGALPYVDLPDLHAANAIYDARGNVFLGPAVRRVGLDRPGGERFLRLLLTLEVALENLRDGACTTKRGLYYAQASKVPDAGDQLASDRALAALAALVGVRRRTLGFVESRRGSVWGRLVLRDGGAVHDLSQLGPAGYGMPRFMDDVAIVDSDAAAIVVVEKYSVAFKLAQARWWEESRCILVCSQGFPSLSAREFVRSLTDRLRVPALLLTDADPAGARVALTYAHGSIGTALETPWLACSDVRWLGLCPSDIDFTRTRELISLTESDREATRRLIEHPSETYVPARMREELAILLERGSKVELDALANDMPRFDRYLRDKLAGSDLVKL